ncbi:cytochrome P450 [Xylaria scruposa]|nr:cytochrome P450 [Xylaria scruposa]
MYTATIYLYFGVALVHIMFWLYVIYQYRFHPLHHYPGPAFAKITNAYACFFAFKKELHLATLAGHTKYGSVLRLGPNRIVFNTIQAAKDIYSNEQVSKSRIYLLTQSPPGVFNMFNIIDKAMHRSRRKVVKQVLSDHCMRLFEPQMLQQIDVFIDQISDCIRRDRVVNMTKHSQRLAVDIIGLLAFGYPLRTQTNPTNRFIFGGFANASWRANIFMQLPMLRLLKIDSIIQLFSFGLREKYLHLLETMIISRLSQPKDAHHDLYSIFPEATDSSIGSIRLTDIWSEALFFLSAGGDTISTALSSLFFYLSRNQEAYLRLAEEVRTKFVSCSDIRDNATLKSCRYLRACVDEALRLSPPVPSTLWREDYSVNEHILIDGNLIPKGVQFGINIYALHHNENYFPDSFSYRPDRWLNASSEKGRIMRAAFMPFSAGMRACTGIKMAYREICLVIAKTIWLFDFEAVRGELGRVGATGDPTSPMRHRASEFQLYHVYSSTHDGPLLVFRRR